MIKIGLLSDTHGDLPEQVFDYFSAVDEIWHAGDIGDLKVTDALKKFKPLRAVFGNIDDQLARSEFNEYEIFTIETVKMFQGNHAQNFLWENQTNFSHSRICMLFSIENILGYTVSKVA